MIFGKQIIIFLIKIIIQLGLKKLKQFSVYRFVELRNVKAVICMKCAKIVT